MTRSLLIAAIVLPAAVGAVELVPQERWLEIPEAHYALLAPIASRSRTSLVVHARPVSFARKTGLDRFSKALVAVAVRAPLRRPQLPALRELAGAPGCRLVVHAEGGLGFDTLSLLEQVGPCFLDVRLGAAPGVLLDRLSRLAPARIVWETGAELPPARELARFAKLPRATISITEDRVAAAFAALAPFDDRITLALRAPLGVLSPATRGLLASPQRAASIVVVADGGLDADAARFLRALPRVSVEVVLGAAGKPPAGLGAALDALARPIDPATERRVPADEADAPLLHPAP